MADLFQYLNLPNSCEVGNTVYKKQFYENADLSRADQDLFVQQVDKIVWAYSLKPGNINIKPYKDNVREYPEIEIIQATVAEGAKTRRLAEIIMRAIPYPMILVIANERKVQLCVAHQRTNQSDATKNTIEEFIFTRWIDFDHFQEVDKQFLETLDTSKMNQTDFYRFYCDIVDKVSIHNAQCIIHNENRELTGEEARVLTARIHELDKQIAELRGKLKKETEFGQRVELNVEIKKLEKERSG